MIESTSRAGLGPLIGQYFGLEHTLGIWKFGIAPLEKEGSPTIHFEKRSFKTVHLGLTNKLKLSLNDQV